MGPHSRVIKQVQKASVRQFVPYFKREEIFPAICVAWAVASGRLGAGFWPGPPGTPGRAWPIWPMYAENRARRR